MTKIEELTKFNQVIERRINQLEHINRFIKSLPYKVEFIKKDDILYKYITELFNSNDIKGFRIDDYEFIEDCLIPKLELISEQKFMACQYDYFYILNNKENLIHFVNAEYEQFNNIPSYIIGLSEPFGLYFDGSDMHPSYCTH